MVLSINYFLSFIILISVLILDIFVYYAYKRDKLYISLFLIPVIFYDCGYAFEILCTNLEWAKFWAKVEYLGGAFLGVLWLLFALKFTGYKEKLKNKRVIMLCIIPIIVLVMNYTNDFHHLFYKDMYMNYENIFPILEVIHGPVYWLHIVYTYSLMFIGFIIFIFAYLKSVLNIRRQILLLMIAWIIPWIADIFYTFKLIPFNIELTSIAFSISAIITGFAVLRFKLLKLNPIALESVFSNMVDGVIILDPESNIVNFNNSAKDIIPELRYIKAGDNKIQNVFNKYEEVIKNLNNSEYNENIITMENKNGIKYYKVNVNNIYQKNHKSLGRILILNDITESRNQQRELMELNEFKDKLFTIVSHDIKSPLAVLVSLLELFEDEDDICKEENVEVLYEIKKNVKSTYELVENVLEWFRSQIDGAAYNNFSWNLFDVIKNSLTSLKRNAELKNIKVSYEIPKDIFTYTDRNMLEIIVRNLFSNAIKFTNKGGSIRIKAKEADGIIIISVSDSGIGIEKSRIEKLFSYSEGYSTLGTNEEKGTGLGLMICKQLIEKNNGKIWWESNEGIGSSFYFTIPAGKSCERK
jgi:signal transduction histidine kinase